MSKTTRTGVSGLAALPAYSAASNTVVARKKHARIISIGALNAIQNSFINKLPIEILVQILIRVKVQDLFSLKKTCRDLHSKLDYDHLWHLVLPSNEVQVNVPPHEDVRNFTASQLQKKCLHSLRWQANWNHAPSSFRNVQQIADVAYNKSLQGARFLPGLDILMVVSSIHATETPRSSISLYAYAHIQGSHLLASLDMPYYIREFSASLTSDGKSLGIGVTYSNSQLLDATAILQVSLPEDRVTTSHCVRQYITPYTTTLAPSGIVHKISMHGKYLAGLLVNYAQPNNTTPQVVPTTLLLVDWVSGSHVALALKLPQGAHPLDISIIQPHIILASTSTNGQSLIVTAVSLDSLVYHMKNTSGGVPPILLQSHLSQEHIRTTEVPIIGFSSVFMSDNLTIRGDQPEKSVSFLVFSSHRAASYRTGKQGQFIHLQLPPSDQLKEMPFTRITSTLFQTPYNETSDLAYVATSGQHSLWLQVPSDRDMSKVVKFTFDSSPEPTVSLDTLLPPIPLLPFRPSTCTTLSLDEGTGRICVGLFNGSLYVLSL